MSTWILVRERERENTFANILLSLLLGNLVAENIWIIAESAAQLKVPKATS